MVNEREVVKEDMNYILSDAWVCEKSPTGAHYWRCVDDVFVCRYCKEKKKFPLYFK